MGYCIFQRGAQFRIPASNHAAALAAVKSLIGREPITDQTGRHFSFVQPDEWVGAASLAELLNAWRWEAEVAPDGDISGLEFQGEKHGDEDMLFAALAPYVEADSYIEMIGEDDKLWRWHFDGSHVYKLLGVAVFPPPSPGCRLDLSALHGWAIFPD